MRQDNKKDDAVSPVIAVILMVAITVVLAGVVFVWAMSFANPQDDINVWQVTIEDASDAASGAAFDGGDVVLTISHNGGSPIEWSNVEVKVHTRGDDFKYALDAYEINGVAYATGTNSQTASGGVISFAMGGAAGSPSFVLTAGSYVDVHIYDRSGEVASQPDLRVS